MLNPTKILVTGAQGFLGRHVVHELLTSSDSVAVMGLGRSARSERFLTHRLTWGDHEFPAPLPLGLRVSGWGSRYTYASVDLLSLGDVREILDMFRPETIVHLAGELRDASGTSLIGTNVMGLGNLLTAVVDARLIDTTIVLGSSSAVYGRGPSQAVAREVDPCIPVNMYGVSKLAAEHVARVWEETHGGRLIVARLFNLIGAGSDERHFLTRMINRVAYARIQGRVCELELDPREFTRDFVDVRDAARAIHLLLCCDSTDRIYNVGSGIETRVNDVVTTCCRFAPEWVTCVAASHNKRAQELERQVADITHMGAVGFVPRHSWRDSVESMFHYYVNEVATIESQSSHAANASPESRRVEFERGLHA